MCISLIITVPIWHVHVPAVPNEQHRRCLSVAVWAEGGVTVTMSTGRVSSPSLTRTNIHLISSLHPCSETPAWPLPHSLTPSLPLSSSSFCLSVCVSPSFWPEKRRAQGVSAPLTAGKCLSVVLDLGGVEGGGWRGWGGEIFTRYPVSASAASFISYCLETLIPVVVIWTEGIMCFLILIHQSVKIISWPFFSATWVKLRPFCYWHIP